MRHISFRTAIILVMAVTWTTGRTGAAVPFVQKWDVRLAADDSGQLVVEVFGVPASDMESIRENFDRIDWREVFRVYVGNPQGRDENVEPLWGQNRITENGLRFVPRFPLRPGLTYQIELAAGPLGLVEPDAAPIIKRLTVPAAAPRPRTTLDGIYPSADVVPENLLKFYLQFSGPMRRGGVYDHIALLDDEGHEVELPFLELAEELWDPLARRLTLFIDPGRIKQGIRPHEEVGPSLLRGRSYQLVVDERWPDAYGRMLDESTVKTFRVGPPDHEPIDPELWRIDAPDPGSSEPLLVTFPEPLDYGLLHRVLHVENDAGDVVDGRVTVHRHETQWRFTPSRDWPAGDYALVVDRVLEDLAGNSVGRPFEVEIVDVAEPVDASRKVWRTRIAFRVQAID